MARFTIAALALTTLASTGTSLYLWSTLQSERESSRAALRSASERLTDREPPVATTAPAPPPVAAIPAPAGVPEVARPPTPRENASGRLATAVVSVGGNVGPISAADAQRQYLERLADPKTRAAMVQQQVAGIRRTMPDLAEALGLDEAGVDRFLTAVADGGLRLAERRAAAVANGSPPSVGVNGVAELEESLAAEFGAETVAKWRDYQTAMPARIMVRNLQMSLVDADLALTKDQRQQLTAVYGRALVETRISREVGSVRPSVTQTTAITGPPSFTPEQLMEMRRQSVELAQARNARIAQEARAILSAEQQAVLERHLRSEVDMQRQSIELSGTMGAGVIRSQ